MTALFLDDEELKRLTGRKRARDQIAWLRARGWCHEVNGAGRPVVAVAEAELRLVSGVAKRRRDAPNFKAIRKAG